MLIRNYLEAKYGVRNATTMLHCEAKEFGIPYPLTSGWLSRYGDIEITSDMAERLRKALEKNGSESALKGLRIIDGAWLALKTIPDANSPGFLQSKAWKRVRYDALMKHGRRCQCCGRSPDDGVVLNVDHILPRILHPELALHIDNLQVLCNECNEGKANRDMTDMKSLM